MYTHTWTCTFTREHVHWHVNMYFDAPTHLWCKVAHMHTTPRTCKMHTMPRTSLSAKEPLIIGLCRALLQKMTNKDEESYAFMPTCAAQSSTHVYTQHIYIHTHTPTHIYIHNTYTHTYTHTYTGCTHVHTQKIVAFFFSDYILVCSTHTCINTRTNV